MDKVDAHVHVFAPASDEFPREVSPLFPAARSTTVEQLLREMDAAGVARAVLVHMAGFGIEHHRYVVQAVQRWPDRFVAAGRVDLGDPDPPARLKELHEATGIAGVRLMGRLGDPKARDVEELPACGPLRRAGELGLNVNLYCPSDQVANIGMLARGFPHVTISLDHLGICPATTPVVDHWGRPRFDDEPIPPATYPQVLDLSQHPNVHIKLSGEYAFSKQTYPFGDMRPMVERVYRAFGAERMMWCSDFPWIREEPGYSRLVSLLDHHLPQLMTGEKELILGGNALRTWFGV